MIDPYSPLRKGKFNHCKCIVLPTTNSKNPNIARKSGTQLKHRSNNFNKNSCATQNDKNNKYFQPKPVAMTELGY